MELSLNNAVNYGESFLNTFFPVVLSDGSLTREKGALPFLSICGMVWRLDRTPLSRVEGPTKDGKGTEPGLRGNQ